MDKGNQLILLLDAYALYVVEETWRLAWVRCKGYFGCSRSLMFKPQAQAWLGVEKISWTYIVEKKRIATDLQHLSDLFRIELERLNWDTKVALRTSQPWVRQLLRSSATCIAHLSNQPMAMRMKCLAWIGRRFAAHEWVSDGRLESRYKGCPWSLGSKHSPRLKHYQSAKGTEPVNQFSYCTFSLVRFNLRCSIVQECHAHFASRESLGFSNIWSLSLGLPRACRWCIYCDPKAVARKMLQMTSLQRC